MRSSGDAVSVAYRARSSTATSSECSMRSTSSRVTSPKWLGSWNGRVGVRRPNTTPAMAASTPHRRSPYQQTAPSTT